MTAQNILLFRKWHLSEIEIKDIGLKTAISLKKTIMPMDFGRSALRRFNKADVNIVERLVNKVMHFGKKNAKNTGIKNNIPDLALIACSFINNISSSISLNQ